MESNFFIYDGVKSSDMGLHLVHIESGMVEAPYYGGGSATEERISGRLTPYFFHMEQEPIEFTITVTPLDKEWTPELRRKLGQWLFKSTFKPFQTSDDLGKIYYAVATEAPNFSLYSTKGYIEITMMTNSPYAWSPVYYEHYNLDNNKKSTIIIRNDSNIDRKFLPKLQIQNSSGKTYILGDDGEKIYTNRITLKNYSNKGKEMIIEGFEGEDETISIDCENEVILSDLYDSKPFKRLKGEWLELVYGENLIEVTGDCQIWTKMQFPILQ